ncbi:MAG: hypothetical protein CM15mP67_08720 [Alphaproteobacteria bacterium]|nr:MAG: hypothetical protein CM15mP67_08720 [Alphaproteobacteria bacterium]
MMKKYFLLTLLFSIIMNGCARQNQIDFSSSEAFFSSLNETKIIQKENKKSTPVLNSLKKSKINNKDEGIIKKSLLLNLSSYEKLLKQKIGFEEYNILKIFNNASLIIKHGKIKNFQFHLKSCHLDLFFLDKDKTYIFKHFDIRPSTILSKLDKKKCVEELNNKFTLIRDPK